MSHSRYSHIDEIWEDFENCKNEREIKEIIDNIPHKFGEFYYEISEDGRTFKITNDYIEWGNFQTDTVDFDFPEKVKKIERIKNIQVKTTFSGWKTVSYEQAKKCIANWLSSIKTMSGQKLLHYINTEKLKGITVEEVSKYEKKQDIIFEQNLELWKDGIKSAEERIKCFYNKERISKDIKYITIQEIGDKYSKRLSNILFEYGYGEWVFRDLNELDSMQKQIINIFEDDSELEEMLKEKNLTKEDLYEQIEGNVLINEIESSINAKVNSDIGEYSDFIKEEIDEELEANDDEVL